jgi:hypothetical protein
MNSLNDFVTSSATKYLQSVVFVDDHIYHNNDKPLETAISIAGGMKPQFVVSEGQVSEPVIESKYSTYNGDVNDDSGCSSNTAENYHPRQLMESFARKGIVCALYEPREKFSTESNSEIFLLCERADVIILDWDIHNDGGDRASHLLSELIKKSQGESPHHVRFCAIYTIQQGLHHVLETLFDNLKRYNCDIDIQNNELHLVAGATRICVFGKPTSLKRTDFDSKYEVLENHLADRVIGEFAALHHGILPAFALHGLASVRRNTKRLLDKFNSELDGAFLLHRALVLNSSDAFDELPELLSDEIRAVLEDSWPSSLPISDIALSTIEELQLAVPSPRLTNNNGADYDFNETFKKFLRVGHSALYDEGQNCILLSTLSKNSFQGIKPKLLSCLESMVTQNGRSGPELLAGLFCNRTHYGANGRRLHFGTIVRHRSVGDSDWTFSLCIMPICDSQRLSKAISFPFWRLKDNTKSGIEQKRYGIALESSNGTKTFAAGGKMRENLWIAEFMPDSSGWVTASQEDGCFKFSSTGIEVEWVAELKPLHAQRIAAHMGSDVARVGLVESEWLRLFCDR